MPLFYTVSPINIKIDTIEKKILIIKTIQSFL